jgi:uncharacterized protein YndB with AHSA1/START domain
MKGPVKWWRRRKLDRALKEHGTVWVDHKDRILGIGYPHWATKLEQRYRALRLARRLHFNWSSTEGWPICGAR